MACKAHTLTIVAESKLELKFVIPAQNVGSMIQGTFPEGLGPQFLCSYFAVQNSSNPKRRDCTREVPNQCFWSQMGAETVSAVKQPLI